MATKMKSTISSDVAQRELAAAKARLDSDNEYRLELIEIMVEKGVAREMAKRMISTEAGLRAASKKYDV